MNASTIPDLYLPNSMAQYVLLDNKKIHYPADKHLASSNVWSSLVRKKNPQNKHP